MIELTGMTNVTTKIPLIVCLILLLTAVGCDLGTYEKRLKENRSAGIESGNDLETRRSSMAKSYIVIEFDSGTKTQSI